MAEYTRGLESGSERSGHNNQQEKSARRLQGIDFEAMNFEQRRAPYGIHTRTDGNVIDEAENRSESGRKRDEAWNKAWPYGQALFFLKGKSDVFKLATAYRR